MYIFAILYFVRCELLRNVFVTVVSLHKMGLDSAISLLYFYVAPIILGLLWIFRRVSLLSCRVIDWLCDSCVSFSLLCLVLPALKIDFFCRTRYSAAESSSTAVELQHDGHTMGRTGNPERSSDGRCLFRNYILVAFCADNCISLTSARYTSAGIQSVLYDGLESTYGVVAVPDGGQ